MARAKKSPKRTVKTVPVSQPIAQPPKQPVRLPSGWQIARQTYRLLTENWKVVTSIVAVYGLLNIFLVRGLNGGLDVALLKQTLDHISHGGWAQLQNSFNIFALLVSSANTTSSDVAGAYQTFLVIVTSLALVWTFRQLRQGKTLRARDGFYFGMYPLIPVLLILVVIGLQAVPVLIGGWLFSTVVGGGIAVGFWEQALWAMLFFASALVSLYLMCSSIFALYVATLPEMTPLKALRSARQLVRHRRLAVLRKLLFLPLLLLIGGAAIMLPFILLLPVLAQWVFFGLSMLLLAVGHGYGYTLYRSLLEGSADA